MVVKESNFKTQATQGARFIIGVLLAVTFMNVAQQALAAENAAGVYPLGSHTPLSGALPPPGVYFANDLYYYSGDADPSHTLPFNAKLIANVHADVWIEVPTILWSTTSLLAGGNLVFSASLPIGGPSIDAGVGVTPPVPPIVFINAHDSVSTFGDPYLTASIGWHSETWHWTAGLGVNVPIGDYQAGEIANVAFHRWAVDLYGGVTSLDMKTGREFSALGGFTFNGENPDTDYKTGTEFHLDFGALQHFPNGFALGLVGYYYQQLSGDSGSGAVLGDFEGRVVALGGTVEYTFKAGDTQVTTRLKVFDEFAVENRLEGTAAYFTVALPL